MREITVKTSAAERGEAQFGSENRPPRVNDGNSEQGKTGNRGNFDVTDEACC
jgi:hypothetical protein